MGITKAQGKRIYMYEAFIIVSGASIMGTISGFIVALLISAQFYMFIEFPLRVEVSNINRETYIC